MAVLAVMTGLAWYLTQPITFTYDSFAYLDAARSIAGVEGGKFAYFRAPLLPLLMAATKVPSAQTFAWFIAAQLLLGVAIVMVMHACLRRISRSLGFFASILLISTFIAFVHSKSVMTEQIYLLGWCLCIDGALAYLSTGARIRLAQVVMALLMLAMSRAQGAFVAVVALPFMAICKPGRLPEIAGSALILSLAIFGYSLVHAPRVNLIADASKPAAVSQFGVTNSTGKMLFMIVYWDPYRRLGRALVRPANGPASKRLFSELKEYYSVPANLTAGMDYRLYGRFAGRPDDLVSTMESQPDGQYWWAIWQAMDARLGAGAADELILRVTAETVQAHPLEVASIYLRNFAVALVAADSSYVWSHPSFGPEQLGSALSAEMAASGNSAVTTKLARVLNIYFPAVQITLLLAVILLAPAAWRGPLRAPWLFCIALLAYNHLTVAVAATPESRYTFYAFPVLLVAVTLGAEAAWEKARARGLNRRF